jgi:hypothetical protein
MSERIVTPNPGHPGQDRLAVPLALFLALVVSLALIYGVYETATKVADLFG